MHSVLYVEDDPNSRDVVRMIQRMNPELFAVTIFEDSHDFQRRLLDLEPQPDLILLDIHVSPLSGFEMLEMIRANPDFDSIPVVALTASVMNEEIQMLKSAGFRSVIAKPLNLDSFAGMIQRIMNGETIWDI